MYSFRDVNQYIDTEPLPSEAVSIDGLVLDNEINGFRTLYVSGRESLAAEFDMISTNNRNGDFIKSRRYPSRTLKVGFQMRTENNSAFREAFNELNGILNCSEVEIRFADEPDFFYIGSPVNSCEVQPGTNSVTGEFEIYCATPFKYSNEHTVSSQVLSDGTLALNVPYAGTVDGHPILEAHMATSDSDTRNGDCGYVAFINGTNGAVLQFGDPNETDVGSRVALNSTFSSNSWIASSSVYGGHGTDGTTGIKTIKGPCVYASSYGSGSGFHGACIEKSITAMSSFAIEWKQRFAISRKKTAQLGMFQIGLWNDSTMVASVDIVKSAKGSNGNVIMRIGSQEISNTSVDLSYTNKYFGFGKAKTKKAKAVVPVLNSSIKKGTDGSFNFSIGGITASFKDTALNDTTINKVTLFFGQSGTVAAVANNGVYSVKVTQWDYNQPNTFGVNDVLIADTSKGEVRLSTNSTDADNIGALVPEYGALGNEWEEFSLSKGNNLIECLYSSWVNSAYKPTFVARWRDLYI